MFAFALYSRGTRAADAATYDLQNRRIMSHDNPRSSPKDNETHPPAGGFGNARRATVSSEPEQVASDATRDSPTGRHPLNPAAGTGDGTRWAYLLVLALAVLSFANIAQSPLHDPDEFNYITAAREMVEKGDWITPHFNDAPRLVKPILFYWIVAGAYKVLGVHMAVARLCSAAGAAVGVFAVWLTARQFLDRTAALLAAVIAATNFAVVQLSRVAITDPTLWAFVALANYAVIRLLFPKSGEERLETPSKSRVADLRQRWLSHLFFAATALAVLTKGPVALAWCLLPLLWPLARRDWAVFRRLRWGSGLLITLIIVAPWTVAFVARNGPALRAELLDPSSTQSYAHFSHLISNPLQFLGVFPQLLTNYLLWLPAIVAVFMTAVGTRVFASKTAGAAPQTDAQAPRRRDWRTFLLFWALLLIVIYGLSYKKSIRYLFPIVGPGSILLADALQRLLRDPSQKRGVAMLVAIYGVIELALAFPLVAIIVSTRGMPVWVIWPHVAIQAAAGLLLLGACGAPAVQRLFPAIIAGALYLHAGLLSHTLWALSGPGTQTLSPLVQQSLRPDEALLCYEISPRVLVFEARRRQVDIQSFPVFLARLDRAPACLIRDSDWERVPKEQRDQFRPVGQCIVQRTPPVLSPDLTRNRQTALLLVRTRKFE